MAYITREYYVDSFHGQSIPEAQFTQLSQAASDTIDAIVMIPIDPQKHDMEKVAKATAYQMETLYAQGGMDATTGKASSQMVTTERLDEYSIQEQQSASAAQNALSLNGIPVSPLAVAILRGLGLMCRWYYTGMGDQLGYE